jgi:hypothetical protein
MNTSSLSYQPKPCDVGVYECEIHLKFRLIEEEGALCDRDQDQLLEALLDAFACGDDEFLESMQVEVNTRLISELLASPRMRRQLLRLRNSEDLS